MLEQGGPDPGGTTPEERTLYRSILAGSLVLGIILVLLVITFQAQTGLPFRPTTTVKAEFTDVHSLRVNDDVRENSRRVGRVSAEDIDGNNALITLDIDGHDPVYANASAEMFDISALATKFVEFNPGTPDAGPLGNRPIAAKVDTPSSDIDQVLDIFDPATLAGTQTTLRQFGGGFVGHGPDFHDVVSGAPDILRNLGTVSTDLASPQFDMPDVLRSADQLASTLHGREADIASLEQQVGKTMQGLSVDGGAPLGATLDKAPGTLRAVRPALDALDGPLADTQATMVSLQHGAQGLGNATPDLRGFLRDSVPVAGQVPGVAEQAVPQVKDLTRTTSVARPLVPRVSDALRYLDTPLEFLKPYSAEFAQLIVHLHSFVSEGPEPNARYARVSLAPDADSVTGGLFPSGTNFRQDVYPKPGQAEHNHEGGVLPNAIGVGGRVRK